jgi:hypothetical protein
MHILLSMLQMASATKETKHRVDDVYFCYQCYLCYQLQKENKTLHRRKFSKIQNKKFCISRRWVTYYSKHYRSKNPQRYS